MSMIDFAALPWLVLFPSLAALWWPRAWPYARWGIASGLVLALVVGQLTPLVVASVAALGAAAWGIQPARPMWVRVAGHVLFVVAALALRQHVVPGFNNPRVFDGQISPDAPRYRMYLNLDELLLIPFILWAWRRVRMDGVARPVPVGITVGLASALVVLGSGYLLRMVELEPKWPAVAPLWMLNNFLLVSLGDEVFFRGYLQQGIADRIGGTRGTVVAIAAVSVLFGLAHYGGGPVFMVLAGMAGVGYGIAYHLGGLRAAWLSHCVLNAVHMFLLTYPALHR